MDGQPDRPTKLRPCRECGVDVEVHVYAADKFVKCPAHRGLSHEKRLRGRKSVLSPLERGIAPEERAERLVGAKLTLRRKVGRTPAWEEIVTATGLRSFDEETGVLAFYGVGGGSLPKFDPRRECGQHMTVHADEVVAVR